MTDSADLGPSEAADPDAEPGPSGQAPQPANGQPLPGQAPYGEAPHGQAPYGTAPPGQPPYGQPGYGQPGSGPPAYGASPYGNWAPQAPKPGVIPLRPLGVGEILDGAFTSVRRNPRATLGLAALVATVSGVILAVTSYFIGRATTAPSLPAKVSQYTSADWHLLYKHLAETTIPTLGLSLIVTAIAGVILTGMLTAVIGQSVLGRQLSIGEAWRITRPRLRALIGSALLAFLLYFLLIWAGGIAVSTALGAVLIAAHVAPLGILIIVLGVITATFFAVMCFVRWQVAAPAVVLEGYGPRASLGRSWRLTRNSWWRVFGILLLCELIVLVATAVLQVPFDVVRGLVHAGGSSGGLAAFTTTSRTSVTGAIITALGVIVAGSVTRPVIAGVQVLLYVDLRMRREGLDIALQAEAGQQGAASSDPGSVWQSPPGHGEAPGQQRW